MSLLLYLSDRYYLKYLNEKKGKYEKLELKIVSDMF